MKKNITSQKENEQKLVPPKNPEELMSLIEKIEDPKLKSSILNLINPS